MKTFNKKNYNPTSLQHNYNFKKVLKREIKNYEDKILAGNPDFDVWSYLGSCLNHTETTIRKFFNPFDTTGTKLGADELLRICILIKSDKALRAMVDEYKSLTNPEIEFGVDDKIDNLFMKLGKESGDVYQAFLQAKADSVITKSESNSIIKEAEDVIQLMNQIIKAAKGE